MFVTQVFPVCNDNRSHYHIENSLPASVQAWRVEQSPVDSLLIAHVYQALHSKLKHFFLLHSPWSEASLCWVQVPIERNLFWTGNAQLSEKGKASHVKPAGEQTSEEP